MKSIKCVKGFHEIIGNSTVILYNVAEGFCNIYIYTHILFLVNKFWTTRARMPLDVGRELTSVFLTLYTLLYHMNISLLHNNDIIA